MWNIVSVIQAIALLGAAIGLLWLAYQRQLKRWEEGAPRRQHEARKQRIAGHGIRDTEDINPAAASRENLKFLGVPDVEAGGNIFNVPCLNPEQEGSWQSTRQVITVVRIVIYTSQGTRPLELVEMTDGYLLFATGRSTYILKRRKLTATEESALERERQEAIDRGDGVIANFCGRKWEIKGAYGENYNPLPGERAYSYLQVLAIHPQLDEPGISTVLPQNAIDGAPHDYFDLQAITTDAGDEQTMLGFYCAGAWSCYIGRRLEGAETSRMRAA